MTSVIPATKWDSPSRMDTELPSPNYAVEWEARPPRAQSAAPSRLIVRRGTDLPFRVGMRRRVQREGVPEYNQGGCSRQMNKLPGFGSDIPKTLTLPSSIGWERENRMRVRNLNTLQDFLTRPSAILSSSDGRGWPKAG